jgi:hypothetical protein
MPNTFKVEDFKGKPTCSVLVSLGRGGEEYWFSFGYKKAKAILEHIEEIEDFCIQEEERGR